MVDITPAPHSVNNNDDEEPCGVCLQSLRVPHESSLNDNDAAAAALVTLRCAHTFHEGCVRPWLDARNICPLCRQVHDEARGEIAAGADEDEDEDVLRAVVVHVHQPPTTMMLQMFLMASINEFSTARTQQVQTLQRQVDTLQRQKDTLQRQVQTLHARQTRAQPPTYCAFCGRARPNKRCSLCRGVRYCNVACQRKDWRARHRANCVNNHSDDALLSSIAPSSRSQ